MLPQYEVKGPVLRLFTISKVQCLMPFSSTTIRDRRRADVRRRDGDAPCALQITADCRVVGGQIDFEARPPHPRSFEVDHVVSSDEAERLGWSSVEADARQCRLLVVSATVKSRPVKGRPPRSDRHMNPRFM